MSRELESIAAATYAKETAEAATYAKGLRAAAQTLQALVDVVQGDEFEAFLESRGRRYPAVGRIATRLHRKLPRWVGDRMSNWEDVRRDGMHHVRLLDSEAEAWEAVARHSRRDPRRGQRRRDPQNMVAQLKALNAHIQFEDRRKRMNADLSLPRWTAFVGVFGYDLVGEGATKNEAVRQALDGLPTHLAKHFV